MIINFNYIETCTLLRKLIVSGLNVYLAAFRNYWHSSANQEEGAKMGLNLALMPTLKPYLQR